MRIAVFPGSFPNTSETFIIDQLAALVERGHDVEIFAYRPREPAAEHAKLREHQLLEKIRYLPGRPLRPVARLATGLRRLATNFHRNPAMYLAGMNPLRFGRRALSLDLVVAASELSQRDRFDLVHVHFGSNARFAAQLNAIGAIACPLVATFHGSDATSLPRRVPPDYYDLLFRMADRITVGSRFMRDRVVDLGGQPEQIELIPMGVDMGAFAYREPRSPVEPPLRLISVGRLVEGKGFEHAVRAMALVRDQGVDARYDLIGAGPRRAAIIDLAQRLGVEEHVSLAGSLPHGEVRRRLAEADVLLMPSMEDSRGGIEGQGIAAIEAEAVGLPVIASRCGGIPDSLPAENHQWLVPPADSIALADAIVRLAGEPERWPAISRAGREHVEAHFDQGRLYDRLVELYRTTAGCNPASMESSANTISNQAKRPSPPRT